MKKLFSVISAIALLYIPSARAQNNDWENPKLVDQGKEKPHVTFQTYDHRPVHLADDRMSEM